MSVFLRFLFLLGLALPARAVTFSECVFPLVYLSQGETPPVALVEQTYFDLLSALGKNLSSENMARIAEGDPFVLPAPLAEKHPELSKRLVDLMKMLEQKAWDTETVRAPLKARLLVLGRDVAVAEKRGLDTAVENTNLIPTALPHAERARLSPDGKYIVAVVPDLAGPGRPSVAFIYDRAKNKVTRQELPGITTDRFEFDAVGAALVFHGPGFAERVPLENGRIEVAKGKRLTTTEQEFNQTALVVDDRSDLAFAYDEGMQTLIRYDFGKGRAQRIELPGVSDKRWTQFQDWGRVTGTDDLWFVFHGFNRKEGASLVQYSFDEKGVATLKGEPRRLRAGATHRVAWSPDGSRFVTVIDKKGYVYSPTGGPTALPRPARLKRNQPYEITHVLALPDGQRVLAYTKDQDGYALEIFSLENPKLLATARLPGAASRTLAKPELSADGQTVIVSAGTDHFLDIPIRRIETMVP